MYILSKKLSSIFLCGSLALMLVGNSGVYAGNGALEASGAVKDKEKLVSSDNKANPEALTLVKNSDVRADENGTVEEGEKLVDSDNETDSEDNEDDDTDDEPEGFSFDSSAVKCLGAAALGTGLVVGTDRVINSFSGSSKPEVKSEQRKAESVYNTQEYKSLQDKLSISLGDIEQIKESEHNMSLRILDLEGKNGKLLEKLKNTHKDLKHYKDFYDNAHFPPFF